MSTNYDFSVRRADGGCRWRFFRHAAWGVLWIVAACVVLYLVLTQGGGR